MINMKLNGGPELLALLDQIPAKIGRNAVRGGVRAAAKVVQGEARLRVRRRSGALARSLKLSTRTDGTVISAKVKAKGKHSFLATFIEYGVAPHWITVDDALTPTRNTRRGVKKVGIGTVNKMVKRGSLVIGGKFVGASVHHPGHAAFPFLRPALDVKAAEAINAMGEYVRSRLSWGALQAPALAVEPDEV